MTDWRLSTGTIRFKLVSTISASRSSRLRKTRRGWKRYGDVTGRTIGTGTGGTGDVGEAVAKLLTAGCVLLLLYGVWLFAIEAAKAVTTVWGQFLYAVAHPFGAGHAFLIACFALSLLALWTVLRRVALYRTLRPWARAVAFSVAVAPSQILLWLTGSLLLTLPTASLLLEPAYVRIAENLPGMVGMTAYVAEAALASMLVVVGVPLTQLVWRTIDRLALFMGRSWPTSSACTRMSPCRWHVMA
ncbi:hypothetical protein [Mesorhizobium sp.]|uniref:hypothetical protein n=1 Tax=Mesorhizobium sp. TaxID=1871066 RepID=UPI00257C5915|nr:hypothetical protein [Mesorhizobium sp.]